MSQAEITLPFPLPEFDWRQEQVQKKEGKRARESHARRYIEAYGFEEDPSLPLARLFILVAVCLMMEWFILHYMGTISESETQVGTVLLGVFALTIGYRQWREARHEISMDKYYDRLEIANRWRESCHEELAGMVGSMPARDGGKNVPGMMFIYAELDNLEYVIEKYRLGYMRADQACRGLRTFQQRCRFQEFRRLARERVGSGDYQAGTRRVVEIVCRVAEGLQPDAQEKAPMQQHPPAA